MVYYNSIATGSADPDAFEASVPSTALGRPNHYRFDMNRDRVAFSQTRDATRSSPKCCGGGRRCTSTSTGRSPPTSSHPSRCRSTPTWTAAATRSGPTASGRATAKAFDARGPGLLHERGVRPLLPGLPRLVHHPLRRDRHDPRDRRRPPPRPRARGRLDPHPQAGRVQALRVGAGGRRRRASADGSELAGGLRDLQTPRGERRIRRKVPAGGDDGRPAGATARLEGAPGVRRASGAGYVRPALLPWRGPTTTGPTRGRQAGDFPKGALVVDMAQPQGAMAKALLEPGQDFEPEFTKTQVDRLKGTSRTPTHPTRRSSTTSPAGRSPTPTGCKAWWCGFRADRQGRGWPSLRLRSFNPRFFIGESSSTRRSATRCATRTRRTFSAVARALLDGRVRGGHHHQGDAPRDAVRDGGLPCGDRSSSPPTATKRATRRRSRAAGPAASIRSDQRVPGSPPVSPPGAAPCAP